MSDSEDRCSFCGLVDGEKDVRRLSAGPGVFVCNACLDLCKQIIPPGHEAKIGAELVCSFCGLDHRRGLVAGPKVYICDECVTRFGAAN